MRRLPSEKIPLKVKLRACPFCHSEKTVLEWCRSLTTDEPELYSVICYSCGAEGPPGFDEHKATSRWNHRGPLPIIKD